MKSETDRPSSPDPHSPPGRFRMGWFLAIGLLLLLAVVVGLTTYNSWRLRRQSAIVAELEAMGVRVTAGEVTYRGLFWLKFEQTSGSRLELTSSQSIAKGLSRPVAFYSTKVQEAQVPIVVEKLKKLGPVREFKTPQGRRWALTDQLEAQLRKALPNAKFKRYDDAQSPLPAHPGP